MFARHDLLRPVKRLGSEVIWTTNDTQYSVVCSLVPFAISFNSFFLASDDNTWKTKSLPLWLPTDPCIYGLLDILTMSPLGYASYLIYKYGGGFMYNDTKVALGLYGTTLFFALFSLPFTKKRNRSSQFTQILLMHLTALGTTYAFNKIDKKACILVVPYAVWTGCYTLLAYAMK